MGGDFH